MKNPDARRPRPPARDRGAGAASPGRHPRRPLPERSPRPGPVVRRSYVERPVRGEEREGGEIAGQQASTPGTERTARQPEDREIEDRSRRRLGRRGESGVDEVAEKSSARRDSGRRPEGPPPPERGEERAVKEPLDRQSIGANVIGHPGQVRAEARHRDRVSQRQRGGEQEMETKEAAGR